MPFVGARVFVYQIRLSKDNTDRPSHTKGKVLTVCPRIRIVKGPKEIPFRRDGNTQVGLTVQQGPQEVSLGRRTQRLVKKEGKSDDAR